MEEKKAKEEKQTVDVVICNALATEMDEMWSYDSPPHIISARLSEWGITFASKSVEGKSNGIPAVQRLIRELDIHDCMVTAEAIVRGKGGYLLDAKGNQPEKEIREYVQDESLRKTMDCESAAEKSRDRMETRVAYTTADVSWLFRKEKWKNYTVLAQAGQNLRETGLKQKNGTTYLQMYTRMEWVLWNQRTGFSTSIFRKTTAALQIAPSSRT